MKKKIVALVCAAAFLVTTPALVIAESLSRESPFDQRTSIAIDGDGQLTADNGVRRGSGTLGDPYVIDAWRIEAASGAAVSLRGTTAHTVISNLTFEGNYDHAIVLENVVNCTIRDCAVARYYRDGILATCPDIDGECGLQIVANTFRLLSTAIEGHNLTGVRIRDNCFNNIRDLGIGLYDCEDVSISNNLMSRFSGIQSHAGWSSGIRLEYCHQTTCEGVRITSFEEVQGITIENSTETRVVDAYIGYLYGHYATIYSVRTVCSSATEINECRIARGMVTALSHGFILRGNELSFSTAKFVGSGDISIIENRFEGSVVVLDDVEDCLASQNLFYNGRYTFTSTNYDETASIRGTSVDNLTIDHNWILETATYGILVDFGSGVDVAGNIVSLSESSKTTYGFGLRIRSTDNLTMERNRIGDNHRSDDFVYYYDGAEVSQCRDVVIQENLLSNDSLQVRDTPVPMIRWNTFSGVNFLSLVNVQNGHVYGNNFAGGYVADFENSNSTDLDGGYPTGGNYWFDFVGDDLYSGPGQDIPGADGIIDQPLSVDGLTDNYPMMESIAVPDDEPPLTYADFGKSSRMYGWFTTNLSVELKSYDALNEVSTTRYRIDGGEWRQYETIFNLSSDGKHHVDFYSIDSVGNSEPVFTEEVWIDRTPPVFDYFDPPSNSTITKESGTVVFAASDNTSGMSFPLMGDPWYTWSYWYNARGVIDVSKPSKSDDISVHIVVSDVAGNFVRVRADYHFDTHVMSVDGPYGAWYAAAVVADLVLLMVPLVYVGGWYASIMDSRLPSDHALQLRDKLKTSETREELEDGYPKYLKKI